MQAGQAEGKSYTSSLDGLRKIIKKDGIAGLYRGIGPKLTQSVATAAILFVAKEKIYNATRKVSGSVCCGSRQGGWSSADTPVAAEQTLSKVAKV